MDKLWAVWSELYRVDETVVINPPNFSPSVVLSLPGQSFLKVTMPAECRFESSSMSSYVKDPNCGVLHKSRAPPGSSSVSQSCQGEMSSSLELSRDPVSLW